MWEVWIASYRGGWERVSGPPLSRPGGWNAPVPAHTVACVVHGGCVVRVACDVDHMTSVISVIPLPPFSHDPDTGHRVSCLIAYARARRTRLLMLALMLKLQLAHLASEPVLVEVAIHTHDAKACVVPDLHTRSTAGNSRPSSTQPSE